MKVKCQICEGRGIVPLGFYKTCEILDRSQVESCKACLGNGWEYVIDLAPVLQKSSIFQIPYTLPHVYIQPFYDPSFWVTNKVETSGDGCMSIGDIKLFETKQPFGTGIFDETEQ